MAATPATENTPPSCWGRSTSCHGLPPDTLGGLACSLAPTQWRNRGAVLAATGLASPSRRAHLLAAARTQRWHAGTVVRGSTDPHGQRQAAPPFACGSAQALQTHTYTHTHTHTHTHTQSHTSAAITREGTHTYPVKLGTPSQRDPSPWSTRFCRRPRLLAPSRPHPRLDGRWSRQSNHAPCRSAATRARAERPAVERSSRRVRSCSRPPIDRTASRCGDRAQLDAGRLANTRTVGVNMGNTAGDGELRTTQEHPLARTN